MQDKCVRELLRSILGGVIQDVGRTDPSDHDDETGQWTKKNGGSEHSVHDLKTLQDKIQKQKDSADTFDDMLDSVRAFDQQKKALTPKMQKLLDSFAPSRRDIPLDAFLAFNGYSKYDSRFVNGELRGIDMDWRSDEHRQKTQHQAQIISDYIEKHSMGEDTLTYRHDKLSDFAQILMNQYSDTLKKKGITENSSIEDMLNAIVDVDGYDKGFTSVTLSKHSMDVGRWELENAVIQEIYIPKEGKASFMAPCSS